ncbi:Transcription factor TFIIIB component B'' [Talaromyces islandicus]|uniref:Transcription factor TFIIIB component B n=1 Tax=Talaromyces islandicus TaxID=28573 RepID=A0A0U1LZR7_TALIS|nr:Transcription factor TFIIIB component B'' [Talaromyces islandicus]
MKSFTSSAINKSGKKFAPKAPSRRPGAASTAAVPAPKRKPNIENQNAPTAPPPEADNAAATAAGTLAANSFVEKTSDSQLSQTVESPAPSSVPVSEPKPAPSVPAVKASGQHSVSPKKHDTISKGVPIPIPTSKSRLPSALPTPATVTASVETQVASNNVPQADAPTARRNTAESALRERDINKSVQVQRTHTNEATPRQPSATQDSLPKLDESAGIAGTDNVDSGPTPEPPRLDESSVTPISREASHVEGSGDATTAPKKGRKSQIGPRKSKRDGSETQVKKQRAKRKREATPDESEAVEIAPTVIKMSELCRDLRTGKKSKREVELRNLESAEAERKQKVKDDARDSVSAVKENNEAGADNSETNPQKAQSGPRMRIVNGEIVIDNQSLQVDRRADLESSHMEDVLESRLSRKINQATYGKRTKAESWDEELTDLFYRGLRMFGTDFMMISKMFPGRSRRQIKLKFNNEERRDPERIKRTLMGPPEAVDIQSYSEMTNTVYDDPQLIQQELDEDKKRIEEQHAKEKLAQEELFRNPNGASNDTNVAQSIEKSDSNNARSRSRKQVSASKDVYWGKEEIIHDH